MTLAVGDLCTVVYADGGVRTALPVEVAGANQNAFLSDFGTTGEGVPLRLRTIEEVAATVPEDDDSPRLLRVIGTLARDGNDLPMFVPLGVLPAPVTEPTADTTFFVVFADTCNIEQVDENGVATFAFYRRKAGEYDLLATTNPDGTFIREYTTRAMDPYFDIPGFIFEQFNMPNVTIREIVRARNEDGPTYVASDATRSYSVSPGARRSIPIANFGQATIWNVPDGRYVLSPSGFLGFYPFTTNQQVRTSEITWISDDYSFPDAIARLRENLEDWPGLPPAIIYHLPLAADAPPGTLNEILPQGVTDTSPLEIISGPYPTVGEVVSRLAAEASAEGIREVRFFTAMATIGGATQINVLIGEIVGALQESYGQVVHSITVAPGNDWLGALADSAEDMPDA